MRAPGTGKSEFAKYLAHRMGRRLVYRRVSDRQTIGSVVQELRASLSEIEKQIDQYFRNPTQREVLIPVPAQLSSTAQDMAEMARIVREGRVRKLVPTLQHLSFNGRYTASLGARVRYITERAVFRLVPTGVELIEIAPGIDLERDVLAQLRLKRLEVAAIINALLEVANEARREAHHVRHAAGADVGLDDPHRLVGDGLLRLTELGLRVDAEVGVAGLRHAHPGQLLVRRREGRQQRDRHEVRAAEAERRRQREGAAADGDQGRRERRDVVAGRAQNRLHRAPRRGTRALAERSPCSASTWLRAPGRSRAT